jgi:hypothetical protein
MRLNTLQKRLQKINLNNELSNVLRLQLIQNKILNLNRDQMWEGKDTRGIDIEPSYLDNPYFKSQEAAENYSVWKQKITPNPKRNKYAPNLFITGYFHNSLNITFVSNTALKIYSAVPLASKILSVHKNVLGLNIEKISELNTTVRPLFVRKIRKTIGL